MVDLHTHSHCSDGSLTPAQLLRAAEKAGVTAVALCDHNTVAGLPEFMAAAGTVEAVPGVEFSANYQGKELHILALFLPGESWAAVDSRLAQLHREKEASNRALVAALRCGGYAITYEEVTAMAGGGWINRAHVAQVLTRKGYTGSVQEAFRTLLNRHGGFYVPPKLPDALETIAFIKDQGAVAVLAHPLLSLDAAQLRTFLPMAGAAGLDAIETMYPLFDEAATQLLRGMACEFGLLESGGSDFHGAAKPDIRIGVGRGTLAVPDAVLEQLRGKRLRK
ncbi:MAG: PHP domain-containing protein [Oscillospiraceae bacterium]|nr:PHP domain-containing protein [Oscillospiraceae bacterium]